MLRKVLTGISLLMMLTATGCMLANSGLDQEIKVTFTRVPRPERLLPHIAESRQVIRADMVVSQLGITGRGVKVGIIDDFDWRKNKKTKERYSHGEWVKNIVYGIAPNADVYICDVELRLREDEVRITSKIEKAIQKKCLESAALHQLRIINMSWGEGVFSSHCSSYLLGDELSQLKSYGIFLVAASGNNSQTGAITAPACYPGVVSVGATWDSGQNLDNITDYSNVASFLDLLAPGSVVQAFGSMSSTAVGTSAAAPIVTGVAALLLEANPSLTSEQIKQVLRDTGKPINARGYMVPRVDALAAVQAVLGSWVAPPAPTPTPPPYVPPPTPPAPPPYIPPAPPPVEKPWQFINYAGLVEKEGGWTYWQIYIEKGDFDAQYFESLRDDGKSGEAWLLSEEQYSNWQLDLPVTGWRWYSGESSRAAGVTPGWYYFLIYNRRDWDGRADPLGYSVVARYR